MNGKNEGENCQSNSIIPFLEYLNSLYILLTNNNDIFFYFLGNFLTKIMIKINLKKPASQFSKENLNRFWWSIKSALS
jgi:hypothetical protein